jgi:hypothetical protein
MGDAVPLWWGRACGEQAARPILPVEDDVIDLNEALACIQPPRRNLRHVDFSGVVR